MKSSASQSGCRLGAMLASLFLCVHISFAQSSNTKPVELVREAVHNEINSSSNGPSFMFREVSQGSDGSKTKLLVETRDAMAGLLIATNGHPLTAEQRQAEDKRLQHLIQDPDDFQKKCKREKEDADRTKRIMSAFPQAFFYEEDGTVTGEEGLGAPGDPLVRLEFRPNPQYSPPSHVEQILTGLQGTMLIDTK
ncbi:MAG: hypothetical protein ACRD2S_06690, partial [Terriglobales bacterium]